MSEMATRPRTPYYAWVLGLGFLTGLIWIFLVRTEPVSDFQYYHEIAAQIARGGQWGDTYTTVGYPIFLALFYHIFGPFVIVAKLVNLALSTLSNLILLKILRKLTLSESARKLIFLLFVFFPMNIYYNSILGSEILFATVLLGIIYLYLSEIRHKYLIIGFLTGLNTMIKPFFPAFFLVILLTELYRSRSLGQSIKKSAIVLLMTVFVLTPWLYRNYQMFGEFSYVSNNGGIVLYLNNNSQNHYGRWMPAENVENSIVTHPDYLQANPVERNKMLTQSAKQWISEHPLTFIHLGFQRLTNTYIIIDDFDSRFAGAALPKLTTLFLVILSELIRAPIFVLGLLGILISSFQYARQILKALIRMNNKSLQKPLPPKAVNAANLFLLLIFWMFTGIYFITEGQSRYAFPVIFILIYFCNLGLARKSRTERN